MYFQGTDLTGFWSELNLCALIIEKSVFDAFAPSFASHNGAIFSDALISALAQGRSLKAAFDEARWATEEHPYANAQQPWLNSDGNHTPNQPADSTQAQRRGFAITGSFAPDPSEQWAPYIRDAQIQNFTYPKGQIWAEVLDDQGVDDLNVWAVIYPPSYEPPTSSEEIVPPPNRLSLSKGDNLPSYGAQYRSDWLFPERGEYRIVIYAEDNQGLIARPQKIVLQTGSELYLPILLR